MALSRPSRLTPLLSAAALAVAGCHRRYESRAVSGTCPMAAPAWAGVERAAAPSAPLAALGTVSERGSGQPLRGVDVRIAALARDTRTDSLGNFRLSGLPPGVHTLEFRSLGFLPGKDSAVVTAAAGQAVRVALGRVPLDGCGMGVMLLVPKPWWKWW